MPGFITFGVEGKGMMQVVDTWVLRDTAVLRWFSLMLAYYRYELYVELYNKKFVVLLELFNRLGRQYIFSSFCFLSSPGKNSSSSTVLYFTLDYFRVSQDFYDIKLHQEETNFFFCFFSEVRNVLP